MDVEDEADALHLSGLEAEQDGEPLRSIEQYRIAIDLLAADRVAHGPRLPHLLLEATVSGSLHRVLDSLDDDGSGAALLDTLDRWELVERTDPASIQNPSYVGALTALGRSAMRLGDLDVARRSHAAAAAVAEPMREPWLAQARSDPEATRGASAVLDLDSLDADLLNREGRLAASAAVLHRSITLVDELGRYPLGLEGARPLMAEANLVGRFLGRASASGWDVAELGPLHDRYVELLGRGYVAARVEDEEMYAAVAVNLMLNGLRLAPACGRQERIAGYADRIREEVDDWAASGSVIAQVLAGDLDAALATFAGPAPEAG